MAENPNGNRRRYTSNRRNNDYESETSKAKKAFSKSFDAIAGLNRRNAREELGLAKDNFFQKMHYEKRLMRESNKRYNNLERSFSKVIVSQNMMSNRMAKTISSVDSSLKAMTSVIKSMKKGAEEQKKTIEESNKEAKGMFQGFGKFSSTFLETINAINLYSIRSSMSEAADSISKMSREANRLYNDKDFMEKAYQKSRDLNKEIGRNLFSAEDVGKLRLSLESKGFEGNNLEEALTKILKASKYTGVEDTNLLQEMALNLNKDAPFKNDPKAFSETLKNIYDSSIKAARVGKINPDVFFQDMQALVKGGLYSEATSKKDYDRITNKAAQTAGVAGKLGLDFDKISAKFAEDKNLKFSDLAGKYNGIFDTDKMNKALRQGDMLAYLQTMSEGYKKAVDENRDVRKILEETLDLDAETANKYEKLFKNMSQEQLTNEIIKISGEVEKTRVDTEAMLKDNSQVYASWMEQVKNSILNNPTMEKINETLASLGVTTHEIFALFPMYMMMGSQLGLFKALKNSKSLLGSIFTKSYTNKAGQTIMKTSRLGEAKYNFFTRYPRIYSFTGKTFGLAGKGVSMLGSGLGKGVSMLGSGLGKIGEVTHLTGIAKALKLDVLGKGIANTFGPKGLMNLFKKGKLGGWIAGAMSIYDIANAKEEDRGKVTASSVGSTGGALLGGIIGSFFGPVGTVIGTMLGGWIGDELTSWLYENSDFFKALFDGLGDAVVWTINFVKSGWDKLCEGFKWGKDLFNSFRKSFSEGWEKLCNSFDWATGIFKKVGDFFDDYVVKPVSKILEFLGLIDSSGGGTPVPEPEEKSWGEKALDFISTISPPIKAAYETFKFGKRIWDKATGTGSTDKSALVGEWRVPKDGTTYTLHAGEMVIPRQQADMVRRMFQNNYQGGFLTNLFSNVLGNSFGGAPNGSYNGPAFTGDATDSSGNKGTVMRFLQDVMHLSKMDSAAITGNIQQESQFNPRSVNDIGATGIAQWYESRRDALEAFASSRGEDMFSLKTQLLYLQKEIINDYGYALSSMMSKLSLEDKTVDWCDTFERPGPADANYSARIAYAQDAFNSYKQGTPFVPDNQLAFLHKGEMVVPKEYNPYNSLSNFDVADYSPLIKVLQWGFEYLGRKVDALELQVNPVIEKESERAPTFDNETLEQKVFRLTGLETI